VYQELAMLCGALSPHNMARPLRMKETAYRR